MTPTHSRETTLLPGIGAVVSILVTTSVGISPMLHEKVCRLSFLPGKQVLKVTVRPLIQCIRAARVCGTGIAC